VLVGAWVAVHLLAGAALLAADVAAWLAAAALGALAVHAFVRRPAACLATIVCRTDGRFDLPGIGRTGLALGMNSVVTHAWVKLALADGGATLHILLVRDQVDDATWRRLLARLAIRAD
jgi:hypothetical protein